MSKLKLFVFEDGAECANFDAEGKDELLIELSSGKEIPVSLGTHIKVARGGSVCFNTARFEDGVYPLSLFIGGRAVTLGHIEIKNGILSLLPPTADFIRELSLRERRLCERVELLEERLLSLDERVNGTPLFKLT